MVALHCLQMRFKTKTEAEAHVAVAHPEEAGSSRVRIRRVRKKNAYFKCVPLVLSFSVCFCVPFCALCMLPQALVKLTGAFR